jgi:hypothetical protein
MRKKWALALALLALLPLALVRVSRAQEDLAAEAQILLPGGVAQAQAQAQAQQGESWMLVGMMSACCDAESLARRAMQRAILQEHLAGKMGTGAAPEGVLVAPAPPLGAITLRFVVGRPTTVAEAEALPPEVSADLARSDVVQFDVEESYRNLYMKTDLLLLWALAHTSVKYIVKADDDTYLHYGNLAAYFGAREAWGVYAGAIEAGAGFVPIRKPGNKWALTLDEFPSHCPKTKYVAGWTYVLSRDVAWSACSALWRDVAAGRGVPPDFAGVKDDVAQWAQKAGLEAARVDHDPGGRETSGRAECSLRRLWFEDTRVGIALAAATNRSTAPVRTAGFKAGWQCCSRWTIAKHLAAGCDAPASLTLPVVHQDLRRATEQGFNSRVKCVYGVDECNRYGVWNRMRKGKEHAPGGCPNACRLVNRTSSGGNVDAVDGLGGGGSEAPLLAIECDPWWA